LRRQERITICSKCDPVRRVPYSGCVIVFFGLCLTQLITAATIDTVIIASRAMNKDLKAVVVQPDPQNNHSEVRYPVLYLLHGWSGSYRDWSRHTDLKPLADTYRLIIVCPDGGYAGWYLDSPLKTDSQYETYIAREVVRYIDEHYATLADEKHRAICGQSMGGHGAISLICKYPGVFGAASSMSGVMELNDPRRRAGLSEVLGSFETDPSLWGKNSCLYLIYKLRDKNKALLFDCGIEDFCMNGNRNIHRKMLELNIAHEYIERPGRHTWEYWVNALEYHLLFFSIFWKNPADSN
jgi:putative tributyrin esterase